MRHADIIIPSEVTLVVTSTQLEFLVNQLKSYFEMFPLFPLEHLPTPITDLIGFDMLKKLAIKMENKCRKSSNKGTEKLSVEFELYEILFIAYWLPVPETGSLKDRQIFSAMVMQAKKYENIISMGQSTDRKIREKLKLPENTEIDEVEVYEVEDDDHSIHDEEEDDDHSH